MSVQSFWIHGNALIAEHKESLEKISNTGWGVEVELKKGESSWFHIPLSAPVLSGRDAAYLETIYLLFYASECEIREVHLYDGSIKIGEFKDLNFTGEHRFLKDTSNTFKLQQLHPVFSGIGISFCCTSNEVDEETTAETETPRLIIASAGAEYRMQRRYFDDTDEAEDTDISEEVSSDS